MTAGLHAVFISRHIFSVPFSVINYEITVVTGDVLFSGTNAKVFVQIYGDKGKTEVLYLESRSDTLERDSTDIFKVILEIKKVFHTQKSNLK